MGGRDEVIPSELHHLLDRAGIKASVNSQRSREGEQGGGIHVHREVQVWRLGRRLRFRIEGNGLVDRAEANAIGGDARLDLRDVE